MLQIIYLKILKRILNKDVLEILSTYEDSENIDYYKVIELMLAKVYDFSKLQNKIYQYLIERINKSYEDGIKNFPDPREQSVE
ncbi:MAG: hypothetical protein ACLRZG_00405 [Streptococcus sp.]